MMRETRGMTQGSRIVGDGHTGVTWFAARVDHSRPLYVSIWSEEGMARSLRAGARRDV
jgi:hypothetical protein